MNQFHFFSRQLQIYFDYLFDLLPFNNHMSFYFNLFQDQMFFIYEKWTLIFPILVERLMTVCFEQQRKAGLGLFFDSS